jgi:hypothetical protein
VNFLLNPFWRTRLIGILASSMVFGCANLSNKVQDFDFGQKYTDIKTSIKETFNAVGATYTSSNEAEPSVETEGQDPNINYLTYQTQWKWETFGSIAGWFTGDGGNWKALAEANPKLNPNRIPVGTPIVIPAELVKTSKLPTEAYVTKYRPKYFKHKVRWPGESLSLIAKWYTGRLSNWKVLAKTNPNLDPNLIKLGDIIRVPPKILETRTPLPRKVAAKSLSNYFSHTVRQPGEKLTAIAKWYTGNAANWRALAKANPDINPQLLLVGNEIYIPSDLIKTRKPLPKKTMQPSASKPERKRPSSPTVIEAPKPKKIKLYGPKQFPKS